MYLQHYYNICIQQVPLVVDPRSRGLGVQLPAAEEVLIFIDIATG